MTTADEDKGDLLAQVTEVFAGREKERGKPEQPTQAGFIELAKAGKDVWNAWRAEWPKPRADFGTVDFRKGPIDFSGFVFGNEANFAGAMFGPSSKFLGAHFGNLACFVGAQFGNQAFLDGAQFGNFALFDGAQFDAMAHFVGTHFGVRASFAGAQFGSGARFDGAQFDASEHEGSADAASFDKADTARFDAWTKEQSEGLWRTVCGDDEVAVQERINLAERLDLRSDTFRSISFAGAEFESDVSFRNRKFLGTTRFDALADSLGVPAPGGGLRVIKARPMLFLGIPDFHGCTLHQDTVFDEKSFENVPRTKEAALAFRTLKLAMAQHQATREEQMFFRLEMEAERPSTKGWKRILFGLYKRLSDYGFGFWQPFILWAACFGVFGLIHASLSDPSLLREHGDNPHWSQWWQYVFINAVPLPGFDRVQEPLRSALFCTEGARSVALVIEAVHKTASLIALFLFGLALRNLFKMKG